ncbi:Band 7 protein [Verrucomicrobia bacterium]|nr:Band 7 protein [Verrucomicrobiota bacterium]
MPVDIQLDRGRPPETPIDTGSQALSEALRSSFAVVKFVMILLVLVFIGSGFFMVGPNQRVIILRFGKPVGQGQDALLGPGRLHWSFPYPIDECVKVSITGVQKISSSVGWYATTPEQELAGTEPPPGGTLNPAIDGYALTADQNIIHTRALLTYHISDPIRYVFSFANASNAVQNALDNALLYTAAHTSVDDVLTREVAGFQDAVRRRVTDLVDQQNLGIVIEQCDVRSIPPRQELVRNAFLNVLKAEVNRDKMLKQASSYENQVLSRASADAVGRTNLAETWRKNLVTEVASRADQFQDLLPKYLANPSLFVGQRLTETLGRVFTNAQDKIYVPEAADGNSMEMRYLFNREPIKPKIDELKPPP